MKMINCIDYFMGKENHDFIQPKVIKEAKIETVKPVIIQQEEPLYQLTFKKNGRNGYKVFFMDMELCKCYKREKENVEKDFNDLKLKNMSTVRIKSILNEKYNMNAWQHQNKKQMDYSKLLVEPRHPAYFSISKNGAGVRIQKTCKGKYMLICHIRQEYVDRVDEVRYFLQSNYDPIYSHEDYRDLLKNNPKFNFINFKGYGGRKKRSKSNLTINPTPIKEAPKGVSLVWSDNGELLFNGLHSGLLPSNVAMIQTLHANHTNPFIFADYVCQNLPEARPSVINYICMNYDEIPFNDLIQEGMEIMDKQRGF